MQSGRHAQLDYVCLPATGWLLRVGYSLTGSMNRPAEKEATGLEVDKLDAAAAKRYMVHYLGMYRDATAGKMGAHGLRAMMFDSWEASCESDSQDSCRLQTLARVRRHSLASGSRGLRD